VRREYAQSGSQSSTATRSIKYGSRMISCRFARVQRRIVMRRFRHTESQENKLGKFLELPTHSTLMFAFCQYYCINSNYDCCCHRGMGRKRLIFTPVRMRHFRPIEHKTHTSPVYICWLDLLLLSCSYSSYARMSVTWSAPTASVQRRLLDPLVYATKFWAGTRQSPNAKT
jgi:hypothetical protein